MEQTQARSMVALAAVLLLLTGLIQWWEPTGSDPEASVVVWELHPEQLVSVEVERVEGDRLVLERRPEGWWVLQPFEHRADVDRVNELLDALDEISRGEPIEDASLDLAAYGLGEPPAARVRVLHEGGARQQLDVGNEAVVGYRTYVRGPGGGVVAAQGVGARVLNDEAEQFRDHRVFRFAPGQVRRVSIASPEGVLTVHGSGTEWWLEGFTRADPNAVDDLILGLLDVRVSQFVDSESEALQTVFRAEVEEDDGTRHVLRVGQNTPEGILLETPSGERGIALAESLLLLTQGPTDVGTASAFPVALDQTDRVTLRSGDASWTAERHGSAWEVSGARAQSGSRERPHAGSGSREAWSVVSALAEARIVYRREPPAPIEAVWAVVEIARGDRVRVVEVGQRDDEGHRIARDREGGGPYRVPVEDLAFVGEVLGEGIAP